MLISLKGVLLIRLFHLLKGLEFFNSKRSFGHLLNKLIGHQLGKKVNNNNHTYSNLV
jgi:hypothetical protein